jgi:hypothetical protein
LATQGIYALMTNIDSAQIYYGWNKTGNFGGA